MNFATWLERSARLFPARPAIAHGTQLWCDYAGFAQRASNTAGWLRAQGVQAGDRVALFRYNCPEYLPLLWGIWWCGAAAVPVNAKLHVREAAWIAVHSGAKVVFCDPDRHGDMSQALQEPSQTATVQSTTDFLLAPSQGLNEVCARSEEDPAWLFYTSGTTGRPKGVTLGARQLRLASLAYLASVPAVASDDVMLHPAPLSHGGGLYHLPYVLNGGLNVVPTSGGFDANECLSLAAYWKNASFFAAPTMVRRLIDAAKTMPSRPTGLATIVYGGGPMYLADIEEALQVIGPHFAQIYGQGECPMTITVLPRSVINDASQAHYRERLASVGFAQSMVEVAICNDAGQTLPDGDIGEICVKGDVVMPGYWNDQAATDAAIKGGWLATGDVGRLDADGFLTLLDRSKDLVISGGTNIYPREVEEALLTHPYVAEVAVIGRPDPEWGEVLVAYVVSPQRVSEAELDAHCLAQIARFKRPKHYQFVAELPKNNYGKVLKTALRELDAQLVG